MFVGWYWLFAGFAWDTRRTKSSLIVTETALNGGGNGDLSWFGGGCNCENLLPDAGKLPGWKMMVFVAPGCHAEQSGSDLSRTLGKAAALRGSVDRQYVVMRQNVGKYTTVMSSTLRHMVAPRLLCTFNPR